MTSFKEYQAITEKGQQAQGRIGGALRGGWIYEGKFYAIGGNGAVFSAPADEVTDLVTAPYAQAAS